MKEKEILQLTYILEEIGKIEFEHNNLFYEIFESAESGYMINIYSSNEKDDDGEYLFENIDGGQFDGNAKDAIEFMLWNNKRRIKKKLISLSYATTALNNPIIPPNTTTIYFSISVNTEQSPSFHGY